MPSKKFIFSAFLSTLIIVTLFKIESSTRFIRNILKDEIKYTDKLQAIPVAISIIKEQKVRIWKEFSGRLTAVNYVEIRPQATGLITEIKFEDGQFVHKGDILFIIDPHPLKVIVAKKHANLIAAQNNYALTCKEYQRATKLIQKNFISKQVYDDLLNTKLVDYSTVKHAEAELSEAKITLNYAYVKSPISGRISRAELTEGNLVSAGQNAPLLTSVVSSGSIYADFELDEQTYFLLMQRISTEEKSGDKNPVELRLQNSDLIYQGKMHAFDNKIDPASGTIRARAIFDNPQEKLLPGMYAHLKLGSTTEIKVILINERAIGTNQNRKFVYLINDKNKATYREVSLGSSINGNRIVNSGLMVGDKVIARGLMHIQPNMLVSPK